MRIQAVKHGRHERNNVPSKRARDGIARALDSGFTKPFAFQPVCSSIASVLLSVLSSSGRTVDPRRI